MDPTKFKQSNVVFAEDQPEYLPLPAYKDNNGLVISCWSFTLRERIKVLFTGRIWWSVLTFNRPLQPQMPSVDLPVILKEAD